MNPSSSKVKAEPDVGPPSLDDMLKMEEEKPIIPRSPADAQSVDNKENVKQAPVAPSAPQYTKYASPEEITYTPEDALKTGLGIVSVIKEKIRQLDIGSQMRKEVWKKELDELSAHSTPTTLIAICGATGAGKSSVINAVLDDTIVPTSGMRACTAVVTEIAYKPGRSIEGGVSFLGRDEWKAELQILLEDLHDEDGKVKAPTDMKSEAGVAWSKARTVHAVYPQIPLDFLVTLTADQIIARDPGIERILGTTRKISAANSKEFGKAIAPFIDSKEKKRGKAHDDKNSKKNDKAEGPALWPLIRIVKVRCPAKALQSGAVLVDLPGTADANAARSSIAQGYMQRCQCVWILAPITRAVDDKTAKDLLGKAFKTQLMMDGNYDTSTVTFVATKTDDLSCNEIINALRLEDDDKLLEIEDRIKQFRRDEHENKKLKEQADNDGKKLGQEFRDKRAIVLEYKAWIRALKDGEPFEPVLTAKKTTKAKSSEKEKTDSGNKRKNSRGSPKAKRRKSNRDGGDEDDSDLDSFIVDDSDSDMSDVESVVSKLSESDKDSDDEKSEKDDDEIVENLIDDDEEVEEEVTIDSLKAKQTVAEEEARAIKDKLEATKGLAKEALKELSKLKTKLAKAQRQKNGFCAKARNDYSRDSLKEDWRAGVKEMDQEAAMQKDPDNFDPSVEVRDYAAIDLPTFTVSSRDYIRLTKQVEGDGDPTCFSDTVDTQIPALQEWCHSLTISSRERTARSFLNKLKTFAAAVQSYLDDMNNVSEIDRAQLRQRWASDYQDPNKPAPKAAGYNPYDAGFNLDRYLDDYETGLEPQLEDRIEEPPPANPDGVAPVLKERFTELVDEAVSTLHEIFKDGLEEKLRIGSATASEMASETSMNFASSMHWATYRAHLRRDGVFRRDLNAELCLPLTSSIAKSWGEVFEQDLFAEFGLQTTQTIEELIAEIKDSAAPGLRERCRVQGVLAKEDAQTALRAMIQVVHEALQKEQKEISRSLSPHVQQQLRDVYIRAMDERGKGSVARQKDVVNRGVQEARGDMFAGGSNILMSKLVAAAETVGNALDASLSELARKVEVLMSVLWEDINTTAEQLVVRSAAVEVIAEISQQIQFWIRAEEARRRQGTLV
ncbi:hypothetical protein FRB90_007375 [Tulasnella sp. 427]|nr:hypothetical protein FRB90_007375 [Tulasnella sp. 427]